MIKLDEVLNNIIYTLNKANVGSKFIKDYNIHNKPRYPYTTVNVNTPYIEQTFRPKIEQTYDVAKDKVIYTRLEQPQASFSFNIYADDRTSAFQVANNTIGALKFSCYDDLAAKDIIVLEISNIRDLTGLLVDDYEYRFQFDLRVRVHSEIAKEVDVVKKIILTDVNNNKDIEIKE